MATDVTLTFYMYIPYGRKLCWYMCGHKSVLLLPNRQIFKGQRDVLLHITITNKVEGECRKFE